MNAICRSCAPILRRALGSSPRLCRLHNAKFSTHRVCRMLATNHRLQDAPLTLRCYSSDAIPAPPLDGEIKYPEKISRIVEQISSLTVAEVADLNKLLKQTLGIQDAPVMAMGGFAAPAQEQEDDEDADVVVKPKEKTQFTVKLTKFDETSKVKLIKQIKALTSGMNLVQAKKFVESAPQVVKADVSKTEAEEMKKQLEEAGGSCEIE
ncbi:39S ribosomal protein L12, mitochondrial-like [Asterias rubens]|uniref:39S ribosomal protein L12, mitochondrial-like n=1 Tax=Asterias rubens TaxID=7604 RepID=UPI0014552073|nr:39S ribosomal protein L12, mitochondrial-like [Asterias rubens]